MNVTEYSQQINALNPYLSLLIFTILMLSMLAMYCLPSIIAIMRQHPQKWLLVALNIFAGWTGLFWIGLLIWSLWPKEKLISGRDGQNWGPYQDRSQSLGNPTAAVPPEHTLEQLYQMKERGALTEVEFVKAKERLINRL
ncbi:superinfection immunity protein [Bombella sp. TMW 2.2559]|uniref:Superinfection immunity protein n=1 Tax=Bombella dulcis TaxID=2967339 RepID=A0ABT3W9H2_9PROT|nr:superinfection immunity protein [Bombella dulcis]MCX5615742.1 superinfection immunity protein [Bombella dulcis]